MNNHAQCILSSHKEAATRATHYLSQARGLKLKQAEALELVARVLGVANWQTLHALAKQGYAPRMTVGQVTPAVDSVDARARQMAELYSTKNGWQEHPLLSREGYVDCDVDAAPATALDTATGDDLAYWRFVIRRLDEIKAIMPWDRDALDDVKVARAAGIDIDYDFAGEDWGVASSEDDALLDLAGQSSEKEAWRAAAVAAGVVVSYRLAAQNIIWADLSLADKLAAVRKALPAVEDARARSKGTTAPKLVPAMPLTREQLLAGGFTLAVSEEQGAVTYVKTMMAQEMPYTLEHIVGTEDIGRDSRARLEINSKRMLVFTIGDEYREEPVLIDSEEGRGVLRDAGVKV